MKTSLLVTLLLFGLNITAQNWFPVNRNGVNYYEDYKGHSYAGYIKDSVIESDQIIYTPQKNIMRYSDGVACEITNNYGWLGKRIVATSDTSVLFYNYLDSAFLIITNSEVGDTWTAFAHQKLTYEVKHARTDFTDVLGVLDSVKIFQITCFDDQGKTIDTWHNVELLTLSKTFGWVKCINFFLFNDREFEDMNYIPYYFTLSGSSNHVDGINNITMNDVFDIQIDDEFHTLNLNIRKGSIMNPYFNADTTRTILKVIDRNDTPDSFSFTYARRQSITTTKQQTTTHTLQIDTLTTTHSKNTYRFLDEEPGVPQYLWGSYQMLIITDNHTKTSIIRDVLNSDSDTCLSMLYDASPPKYIYIKGAGIYYNHYSESVLGDIGINASNLTYYKKGSTTWGTPWPANVGLQSIQTHLSHQFYPNPAASHVQITYQHHQPATLVIYSTTGQMVQQYAITSSTNIDISALANGLYFYEITSGNQTAKGKFVKQ